MGYWGVVARRAARAALQDAKLTTASVVTGFIVQAMVALILFVALGFTDATLWARALTALTPFLTFPIAFGVRFLTEPANIYAEDRAKIEALERAAADDPISHRLELGASLDRVREAGRLTATVTLRTLGDVAINVGPTSVTRVANGTAYAPQMCDAATIRVRSSGMFYFDCGPAPAAGETGTVQLSVETTFGRAGGRHTRRLKRDMNLPYRVVGEAIQYPVEITIEEEEAIEAT